MPHSTLSSHRFHKGKFITPWNDNLLNMIENSWFQDRFPEYIWIALILNTFGREEGMKKCDEVVLEICKHKLKNLYFSTIINADDSKQKAIFNTMLRILGAETLSPLTLISTYSNAPIFSSMFAGNYSIKDRYEKIADVLTHGSDHQSDFSTDIRYFAPYYLLRVGRLHFTKQSSRSLDFLLSYPQLTHDSPAMGLAASSIRSSELTFPDDNTNHKAYVKQFWQVISNMTECKILAIEYKPDADDASSFMSQLERTMEYFSELFSSVNPLDNKMLTIMGMAIYSYKRLQELVNHNLFNAIVGRSIVRALIENLIVLKYLLLIEDECDNVWTEYQYYGIGQFKLIAKRSEGKEAQLTECHVNFDILKILVNEFKDEEFIDMDTSYFDKKNVREKAIAVNERDLFGLYYDYDSQFEHGLWGAVRESSLIKCVQAGHQYHCIMDVGSQQNLPSVWHDCKHIMCKIIRILIEQYGLPKEFSFNEVDDHG